MIRIDSLDGDEDEEAGDGEFFVENIMKTFNRTFLVAWSVYLSRDPRSDISSRVSILQLPQLMIPMVREFLA